MSDKLIKQMREQRMAWLELQPGKSARLIRPTQIEVMRLMFKNGTIEITLEQAQQFVVDWQGFTQADLLGASVGSSDALDFDKDLWREVSNENAKWLGDVANRLLEMVLEKHGADRENQKNF